MSTKIANLAGMTVGDIEYAYELEAPSFCHLCGDVIDYCQGHAGETCDCICDEGCYCGECDFSLEDEGNLMFRSLAIQLVAEGYTLAGLVE